LYRGYTRSFGAYYKTPKPHSINIIHLKIEFTRDFTID